MLHLPIRTSAALICLFTAGFAQAEVSFARRGKLAGVVEIKNNWE